MKMLKKSLIVIYVFTAAFTLMAATTGSVVLQGSVPGILEVTVTAEAGYNTLDLTTSVTDLLVATVVERSNKKAGYTVSIQSGNAVGAGSSDAFFKSADAGNSDTLSYTISYGGASVSLISGSATVSDVSTRTSGTGTSNEVRISYDGSGAFLFEDTYSDNLTFTITAK